MSLEFKKNVKKLVLVLAIFMLVIITRKKAVENTRAASTGEDGEDGKYLRTNFAQILYI